MGRRINVGCGPFPLPAPWENYDLYVEAPKHGWRGHVTVMNALDVDYRGAELVYGGHFVEHLTVQDAQAFFRRVHTHAPGAVLVVTVPVLDRCTDASVDHALLQQIVSHLETGKPGIHHRSWWRTKDLVRELTAAGYASVSEWANFPHAVAHVPWQIILKGNP